MKDNEFTREVRQYEAEVNRRAARLVKNGEAVYVARMKAGRQIRNERKRHVDNQRRMA